MNMASRTLDAEAQTIASMNIGSHPLVNFNAAGSCPSAASKSKKGQPVDTAIGSERARISEINAWLCVR
jgi:hypothetical protein